MLIDVVMPQIDGFQLAAMIREHPRFQKLAIIFVSAVQVGETDHLRGYEIGAVDYVTVPVVPEVLRAKVRVFVELYRKTRQLEALNSRARGAGRRAHRRARGADRAPAPERGAPLDRAVGRRHGLVGSRPHDRPYRMGRRSLPDLRRRSGDLPADRRAHRGDDASRRPRQELGGRRSSPPASRASRSSSASSGRAARCAGATAPASSRATPTASRCA